MKRMISICLLLCMLACVPTPEQDAVKQKDTVQMIESVKSADAQHSDEPTVPVREQMPDRLRWDFTTEIQHAHVFADLPITILTDGDFPLLRVERRTLSEAENTALAKALLSSEQVYRMMQQKTKEELVEEIAKLTDMLADPSPSNPLWRGFDAEDIEMLAEGWAEDLEEMKEQYRALSDDGPAKNPVWDGTIGTGTTVVASTDAHNALYCDHAGFLFEAKGQPDDWSVLYSSADSCNDIWDYEGMERIDPSAYDTAHDGAVITPNDAIKTVQTILDPYVKTAVIDVFWDNNAGDSDAAHLGEKHAYTLHLMPYYYGTAIGVYLTTSTGGRAVREDMETEDDEPSYSVNWWRETISATVSDDGLLCLEWRSPLKVSEVIAEHCPLLPFDEIEQIAIRQLNRRASSESFKDSELVITNVTLGLVRIAEPYEMEQALLTPVWCFFGDWRPREGSDRYLTENINGFPLLEINAVDGTIIDPGRGY